MVSFTTGLTGWIDRPRSSVFLINCIVCGGIVGNFIVGVRVRLISIITVVIISTIVLFGRDLSLVWVNGTDFYSDMAFCKDGNLVWAFLSFVVRLVASQCLSAVHVELPNHSVLTPFQDATQSVLMCHSPNVLGWLISSGGEVFWHTWIVQLLLERQLRMRLSLTSGVRLKNQFTSGLLDWRPVDEICVSL